MEKNTDMYLAQHFDIFDFEKKPNKGQKTLFKWFIEHPASSF